MTKRKLAEPGERLFSPNAKDAGRRGRLHAKSSANQAARRVQFRIHLTPRLTHPEHHESVQFALSEGLARMANRSTIQGSYPCVQ